MAIFSNGPVEIAPTPTPPPEPTVAEVGARIYGHEAGDELGHVGARVYGAAPSSDYRAVTTGVNESYHYPNPYTPPPRPYTDTEGTLGQVTEVTDDEAEALGRRIYPAPAGNMSPASLGATARRMYGA